MTALPARHRLWRFCLLLAALQLLQGCRAQPDPIKLGADGNITDKWWFWVIIGVISAFLIVAAFFVWRGFRNYRRYKAEMAALEERERAEAAGLSSDSPNDGKPKDVELGSLTAAPPSDADASMFAVDDAELARRVGGKKSSKLTASQTSKF